jgi:hypothetical protein
MVSPVEFLLSYSSEARKSEYRAPEVVTQPQTVLRYRPVMTREYVGRGLQHFSEDPRSAVTFVPELRLSGNVTVQAVLDRIILTFVTARPTSFNGIKAVFDTVGLVCFVEDLRQPRKGIRNRGGIELPPGAPAEPGRAFAVLVQDPQPTSLAHALRALEDKVGLVSAPRVFLVELSVDYFPKRSHDLAKRTAIREQLVGLLQRHHLLMDPAFIDGNSDARQVYPSIDGSRTEDIAFLFSSPGGLERQRRDASIEDDVVRKRLDHGRYPHQLFLDSTLYRGSQLNRLEVRTQHKHADKRDTSKGTMELLAEEKKRARIEVEVAGYDRLQGLGLNAAGDLGILRFRTLRNEFLQFWLPTAPEDEVAQIMVRNQLQWRGVYGIELLQELETFNADDVRRQTRKQAGVLRERNRRGQGTTRRRVAWEECQAKVGHALDALQGHWRGFGEGLPWR